MSKTSYDKAVENALQSFLKSFNIWKDIPEFEAVMIPVTRSDMRKAVKLALKEARGE